MVMRPIKLMRLPFESTGASRQVGPKPLGGIREIYQRDGHRETTTSDGAIRNSNRPDRPGCTRRKRRRNRPTSKMPDPPPLHHGERSDNLPVVFQRRPLWLFVQPVERKSRMERAVRSVPAAQYKGQSLPRPPDSPITWPARWPT